MGGVETVREIVAFRGVLDNCGFGGGGLVGKIEAFGVFDEGAFVEGQSD